MYQRVMTITDVPQGMGVTLRGFTIACGNATNAKGEFVLPGCESVHHKAAAAELPVDMTAKCPIIYGAGICIAPNVSVHLDAMRVISNFARTKEKSDYIIAFGGGIFGGAHADISVTNSEIMQNYADSSGGIDSSFIAYAADRSSLGGGLSSVERATVSDTLTAGHISIRHSVIKGNQALLGGPGGISAIDLLLEDSIVADNALIGVRVSGAAIIRRTQFLQNFGDCGGVALLLKGYGPSLVETRCLAATSVIRTTWPVQTQNARMSSSSFGIHRGTSR